MIRKANDVPGIAFAAMAEYMLPCKSSTFALKASVEMPISSSATNSGARNSNSASPRQRARYRRIPMAPPVASRVESTALPIPNVRLLTSAPPYRELANKST